MAALIAVGIVGGVQAVRAGVKAHRDHKLGLTPEPTLDAQGRVKKAHPVYRWVSKMEAKRKNKGEGSSQRAESSSASREESTEERVMREKDPQMYSRPAPVLDAPPSYADSAPAYEPSPAGFGSFNSNVPEFPSVPTSSPSAATEKILLALGDIGADTELEGLVDLMHLGQDGGPPQIDIKQLYEDDLGASVGVPDEEDGAEAQSIGSTPDQVLQKRRSTAKQSAQWAQQVNVILREMQSANVEASDNEQQMKLHVRLQGAVEKLEARLNQLVQVDARLADLQGSQETGQRSRQRAPVAA